MIELNSFLEGLLNKSNKTKTISITGILDETLETGDDSQLIDFLSSYPEINYRSIPDFTFKGYKPDEPYCYAAIYHGYISLHWLSTYIATKKGRKEIVYPGDRCGLEIKISVDNYHLPMVVGFNGSGNYSRPGDRYVGKIVEIPKELFDEAYEHLINKSDEKGIQDNAKYISKSMWSKMKYKKGKA